MEQQVYSTTHSHKKVEKAVVVVISPGTAAGECEYIYVGAGDFGEVAAAIVVVQKVFLVVIANDQIEQAIVVVISPGAALRNPNILGKRQSADLVKSAVPIIVIE